jgi:hypothetical protein
MILSVMLTHISTSIAHIYECGLFLLGLVNADSVLLLCIRGSQRSAGQYGTNPFGSGIGQDQILKKKKSRHCNFSIETTNTSDYTLSSLQPSQVSNLTF